MAAAEEQHRRAQARALRFSRGALLQEAAERRKPRAGADHDDRHRRIVRQAEAGLGLADRGMNGVADAAAREIVRADAPVDAAARTRGRLDHGDGDAAARRIARGRGRDRIIARRQQRQHFEVGMERQFAGRIFLQQVEHRFASGQNLGAVKLGRGPIVADIGQQFRLGHRTARMLRHDLDLLAGRDLLQFDELGEQPADRDDITDRQLRAAAFGDLQADLVRGQETETARDRIDQRRIVARHHAEMIADAIRHIRRQLHLDMPGRTVRRDWRRSCSAARC